MPSKLKKSLHYDHFFFVANNIEPLLNGFCDSVVNGVMTNVYCYTSVDNTMVMVTYNCSFDGLGSGVQPEPCNNNY